MTDFYVGPHQSQYQAGASAITRTSGCTWTAGANGIDDSTGGHQKPTPDALHNKLPRSHETNPATPGWSLPDLHTASVLWGVAFIDRTNVGYAGVTGWNGLKRALAAGRYVVAQGDSDQFSNSTCSGAFNGDHAIGISPKTRVVAAGRQHWIDDGICKTGRWEYDAVIYRYCKKLAGSGPLRWGAFVAAVPKV